MGLPFSCCIQVSHTALCFLYLIRCLLIKETTLVSMIRYSLFKYDKTCIAITLLVKNLQIVYFFSRGVPKWTFYKYIVCQIYEKKWSFAKKLLSNVIETDTQPPHKMQITVYIDLENNFKQNYAFKMLRRCAKTCTLSLKITLAYIFKNY